MSSSNPTTASNSNPTITVTYPKGGEIFHVGQVITITWNTTNLSNNAIVTINCNYPDGAGIYASSLEGVPNNGSFKWTIPSDITLNGGKARITIANDSGQYLVNGSVLRFLLPLPTFAIVIPFTVLIFLPMVKTM